MEHIESVAEKSLQANWMCFFVFQTQKNFQFV